MHQNLAWLTQKSEEPKSNKGNFTFPSNTVNMIEPSSNKKVATPPFPYQPPPLYRFIPLSSKKFCTPQVTQFLEGRAPLPSIRRWGGGGSDYVLWNTLYVKQAQVNITNLPLKGFGIFLYNWITLSLNLSIKINIKNFLLISSVFLFCFVFICW